MFNIKIKSNGELKDNNDAIGVYGDIRSDISETSDTSSTSGTFQEGRDNEQFNSWEVQNIDYQFVKSLIFRTAKNYKSYLSRDPIIVATLTLTGFVFLWFPVLVLTPLITFVISCIVAVNFGRSKMRV